MTRREGVGGGGSMVCGMWNWESGEMYGEKDVEEEGWLEGCGG